MRPPFTSAADDLAERASLRLSQLAAAIDASSDPSAPASPAAPPVGVPEDPEDPLDGLSALPDPGRHATRRREPDLRGALSARWPAPVALASQHLAVLALVVAVVVGGTAWWLLRARGAAEPVLDPVSASAAPLVDAGAPPGASPSASPGLTLSSDAPSGGASGGTSSGAPSAKVTVDVVGKVRHPGIAVLDAGARVVDAVRAAGGARHGVDLSTLNLARLLVDGEQIAVGVAGAGGAPAGASGSSGSAAAGGGGGAPAPGSRVNLNTATQDQLEGLPEVGPVTAQAILAYRQQNGGFTSVDQLLEVQGIGPKTLAQLTPYVTV